MRYNYGTIVVVALLVLKYMGLTTLGVSGFLLCYIATNLGIMVLDSMRYKLK
ncbi:MAG: hypothetical protein ACRC6A_10320 [Fusobacteriaceae bacterium]